MTLKFKQYLFFTIWLLLILLPVVTVLSNTSLKSAFSDGVILINVFQRIFGLLAITLLFIQIILGAFLLSWVQIIGAKAYKIHTVQGIFTYGIICGHVLLNSAIVYALRLSFVKVLVDILPKFATERDLLIALGKTAFVLISIGAAAGYFRTKPFLRKYWRVLHAVNYFVFIFIAIHSRGLGTDIRLYPYNYLYWIFVTGVAFAVVYRIYTLFFKKYFIARQST